MHCTHGKQIVLAADRSPSQLGMGESKFDERDTSRMDSGVTVSVQVPDYELKLNLVNAFYERMKADAAAEHIRGMDGTISDELRRLMAERAGTSIRLIKGFVQSCLMLAHQKETHKRSLSREDIIRISQQKWPTGQHIVTIDQIQKAVEGYYDISHDDLVGSKRNKELMEPVMWPSATREMTYNTLADIGKVLGIEPMLRSNTHCVGRRPKTRDRIFYDKVESIRNTISDSA
jgi:chromosomal replication initiator protein